MTPEECVLAGGHRWPQWKRTERQAADEVKLVCKQCDLVQTVAGTS